MWALVCVGGIVCAGLMGLMYEKGNADGCRRKAETDPIDLAMVHDRCVRVCRHWLRIAQRKVYHPELRYVDAKSFGVNRVTVMRVLKDGEERSMLYVDFNGIRAADDALIMSLEDEIRLDLYVGMSIPVKNVAFRFAVPEHKGFHRKKDDNGITETISLKSSK